MSPVYYNLPLYRSLAADARIDFTVLFASSGGVRPYDDGYGREVAWDLDMLDGYKSKFLRQADHNPIAGGFFSLADIDVVAEVVRGRFEVLSLFGYNFLTHLLALASQRAMRGHVLFREEQTLLHSRPLLKTLTKEVALRALFARAGALYVSTENRRWFEHYGIPPERLFFTPYAVDNARLESASKALEGQRAALRQSFGIAEDAGPIVLTVSRLIPKKQVTFLLEAYRRVRRDRQCTLLIVGSGPDESQLRHQVRAEAIPDVVFAGFLNQSEVPRAYACADIFALLSRENETFGVVTNEAMNFGLPLVLSDKVGCATDLLFPGINGFRVSAVHVEEAAEGLRRLVDQPPLRQSMGDASRRRIHEWTGHMAAEGTLRAVEAAVGPERWSAAT